MITRGYLIGEIVDGLSSISHQIETRCMLGLTDLNKYIEDFVKEILNSVLGIHLVNLNSQRSNVPGLDLGDMANRRAFQITSQKTSQKITETLEKITDEQLQNYNDIRILIVGKKQGSYTIEQTLLDRVNFNTDDNIWDLNTLCRLMIDLPLDKVKDVYDYMSKEITRVKIELEIPNKEGEYTTNIHDYVEAIPQHTTGSGETFRKFLLAEYQLQEADLSLVDVRSNIDSIVAKLTELPRITRQFFSFLMMRGNKTELGDYYLSFNFDKLRRICRYPDLEGELRLLEEASLVDIDDSPREEGKSEMIRIYHRNRATDNDFVLKEIANYIQSKGIAIEKVIVGLDFSDF